MKREFVVLAIFPLLFLGVVLAWQSYNVQINQALLHQHEISARAQERIKDFFHAIEDELIMVSKVNNLLEQDKPTRHAILSRLRSYDTRFEHDIYNEIILLDSKGKVRDRVSRTRVYSLENLGEMSGADEFRSPMTNGEIYYSAVFFNTKTGEPSIVMGIPMTDIRSGATNGVLVAEIRLKKIWNLVADLHIGNAGNAFLLDRTGKIIAHRNPSLVLKSTYFKSPDGVVIRMGLNDVRSLIDSKKIKLGSQEILLVTERPITEALNLTFRILAIIGLLLVIALAGAVTYGLVVTRKIIEPIESLADTAQAIVEGDLSRRATPDANDEIGLLADTFNTMATQLIETIESINSEKIKSEAIIAGIGDPLSIVDTDFRVIYQNTIHKEMLGEHVGKYCYQAYEHREQVCDICPMAMAFADGKLHKAERTGITDRGLIYVDVTASPIMDATGRVIAGIEIGRDITKRKLAEKELAAEKNRLTVTLASIGDAVIATDTGDVVVLMNKVAENLTGWTKQEAVGTPLSEVLYIINEKNRVRCKYPMGKIIKTATMAGLSDHMVLISRDGTERVIAESGAPIMGDNDEILGTVLVFRDITEIRKIEEELLNAKKLEAVGILSAGIAHEINNPLTNASLRIQIMKQELEENNQAGDFWDKLESIEKNVDRASTIAKELLEFSRQRELEFIPVDINSTLHGALLSLEHKLTNIKVNQDLAELPEIPGDPVKLEQVFINILNNAVEAMTCGGNINIATSCRDDYVKVRISDTGSGIREQHLARVFDPFFTTKEVGVGMGLGLSICYGIVMQHNGSIDISNTENTGTIVTVKLPLRV